MQAACNCLYRALSKQLANDSEQHGNMRAILVKFAAEDVRLLKCWITSSPREILQKNTRGKIMYMVYAGVYIVYASLGGVNMVYASLGGVYMVYASLGGVYVELGGVYVSRGAWGLGGVYVSRGAWGVRGMYSRFRFASNFWEAVRPCLIFVPSVSERQF
jgi:hypothetical protein